MELWKKKREGEEINQKAICHTFRIDKYKRTEDKVSFLKF